jgi:cell division protein FtsN
MARGDEREFELVLGNKQLLSMFFLVVVLLAVFFSLGYMVGKSFGPGQTLAAEPPATSRPDTPADRPAPVLRPPVATPSPEADAAPPGLPLERTEPAAVRETRPGTDTKPARTAPARTEPVPSPVPEVRPPSVASAPAPAPPGVALRGLHLQIAAVRVRPDAEALAESLRKKGYDVRLNDQATDGWYRLLLGPFPDDRAAREMRDKLEKDGYKSILRRP